MCATCLFQVQKDTVRKISDLSVDKLIAFFIQTKGTGKEIPSELICVHVCVPMSLLMIIAGNCPTFIVYSMTSPLIMYCKFVWPNLIWPDRWLIWL